MPEKKDIIKGKDWKRVTLYITPEEHKKLRMVSFEIGKSMSEHIRKILYKAGIFEELKKE